MTWQAAEELEAERAAVQVEAPRQRAFAWLLHNVVVHTIAGVLWCAADLGAGEWVQRLGDRLHDSTAPA